MSDSGGAVISRDGDLLRVAIVGRVTEKAVGAFESALIEQVDVGTPFTILFDRSRMTAPTPGGRDALERWGETVMPRLAGVCVGWADVYDAKRAASLARAAEAASDGPDGDAGDEGEEPAPYPQNTFDDLTAAEHWLRDLPHPTRGTS